MSMLKTDGTKMTMEEISDLLIFAALGGDKPEEVSWSAWLAALERVWLDSENELERCAKRKKDAEAKYDDAYAARDFHKGLYQSAEAANVALERPPNEL